MQSGLIGQQGLAAQPALRFELLDVFAGVNSVAIYYHSVTRSRFVVERVEFNSKHTGLCHTKLFTEQHNFQTDPLLKIHLAFHTLVAHAASNNLWPRRESIGYIVGGRGMMHRKRRQVSDRQRLFLRPDSRTRTCCAE